jgi:hypothetical protein
MSRSSLVTLAAMALVACNAILGNESDYSLRDDASGAGSSTGGTRAGSSSVSGNGATSSKAGSTGNEGGNGPGVGGDRNEGGMVSAGGDDGQSDTCLAPSRCVPAPAGSELGFIAAEASQGCPSGYSEVMLHSGLTADGACEGCSCAPKASRCDSSIVGHGAYPCPSFQTSGNSYVLLSTSCSVIAPGASVHFYSVLGFAECTPQGVATPAAPEWAETVKFCQLDSASSGGCPAGSVCVAATTEPTCALLKDGGSCSADYPNDHGEPLATDYDDQRSCGDCQCGFGNSACTGGKIQVFSGPNCTGNMAELGPAEGDACPLPFAPASGIIVGSPASNSCDVNNYPNGTLEPIDPRTLCCK